MENEIVDLHGQTYRVIRGRFPRYGARAVHFSAKAPLAVCAAIIGALSTGKRIRVWYGDQATGQDWGEEYDVTGRVGLSTGWAPIPILIHNSRSYGGGALTGSGIVKIVETATGAVLYQHPQFRLHNYEIATNMLVRGKVVAFRDNEVWAYFDTKAQAERRIAFLTGRRMNK